MPQTKKGWETLFYIHNKICSYYGIEAHKPRGVKGLVGIKATLLPPKIFIKIFSNFFFNYEEKLQNFDYFCQKVEISKLILVRLMYASIEEPELVFWGDFGSSLYSNQMGAPVGSTSFSYFEQSVKWLFSPPRFLK